MTEARETTEEKSPEEQVAEAIRNIPVENFEIEAEDFDPNQDYGGFATFDDIKKVFPEQFVIKATFKGQTFRLLCKRMHPYDIYGQEDFERPEDREITSHEIFMDAIKVLLKVPVKANGDPVFTQDELMSLPMGLVSRWSAGIMREISPRFADETTRALMNTIGNAPNTEGA